MRLIRKTMLAACIAASLISAPPLLAANKADVAALFEQVKLNYEIFTLENGLTVLVYPDHSTPEVYVGVYYAVGSKDEPAGKTGFAHLYEHLMFQGTANIPGDYFSALNKIGASSPNGTTSTDRTNYFQVVPTGSLDAILWLESDRMANITTGITQQQLDNQREVVKNEKRQREASSKWQDVFTNTFYPKGHPYDHSPIGSMEDLNNATLEDVHQWFQDYYGASNAILVLAGDVDVKTAREKATHYFSDVVPGRKIARVEQNIPQLTENRKIVVYDKAPAIKVTRVWPLSSNNTRDFVLMEFMASALAGDKESPLTKLLKDELRYVTDIRFRADGGIVNGDISLSYTLRPEAGVSVEQVSKIIDEQFARFFKSGPDKTILATKLLNEDATLIRSMKSTRQLASHLAESLIKNNDAEFFRTARKWQYEAKNDELKAIAKKWLSKPYLEMITLPEPQTTMLPKVVDRTAMPEIQPTEATVKFPQLQETTLSNGLKLVVIEQQGIPMVDVTFQIKTGTAVDHHYADGTAARAFSMMNKGTKRFNENELIKAQKSIATQIGARTGEYTSSVGFNALTPYLDDAMKLTAEMLRNPAYPQKELDKSLEEIDRYFDQLERNPGNAAGMLYNRALWGKEHLFGKITTREEAKAAVSRDLMLKFQQAEIGANNTTVYMMGDITLDNAQKLLQKYFGDWHQVNPSQARDVAAPQSLKGTIILLDTPHVPSATITAGQLIGKYDNSMADALSLANGPFGGTFESRINMNLREEKGWSYGARSAISQNPYYEQRFNISTQVQADKLAESVAELQKELNAYTSDKPVTADEINKLKFAWIQAFPSQFSNDKAYLQAALRAEAFNLPYNYAESYPQRLNNVSLEQIRNAVTQTIKPDEMVWFISGELSKFEAKLREMNPDKNIEVWDIHGNKIR